MRNYVRLGEIETKEILYDHYTSLYYCIYILSHYAILVWFKKEYNYGENNTDQLNIISIWTLKKEKIISKTFHKRQYFAQKVEIWNTGFNIKSNSVHAPVEK